MAGRQRRRKETQKNATTQTTPDKTDAEIMQLKETVKLLKENLQQLKENFSNIEERPQNKTVRRTLENIGSAHLIESPKSSKVLGKGCNCKGKCANKICGCVKKNIPCGEFCRCNDSKCQNQEPDKENIGDPNSQSKLSADGEQALQGLAVLKLRHDHPVQAAVQVAGLSNKQLNEVKKIGKKSLFSPDSLPSPQMEFSLSVLELDDVVEFGDIKKHIHFDSDNSLDQEVSPDQAKMKNHEISPQTTKAQVNKEHSSDKSKKRKLLSPFYNGRKPRAASWDISREKSESPVRNKAVGKRGKVKSNERVSSTQNTPSPGIAAKLEDFDDELEFSTIDPMKPTRQLPRTPVTGSSPNDRLELSGTSVTTSEQDSAEEILAPPEGIEEPIVDWDKHCAQLVPCKLCRRKFYPHRLPKHEASCKKL